MGISKRLKMFIKEDRPFKLKSWIASHDVDARRVSLSHGRSLLHYCAEFGSPDMLRCLLRLECEPNHQDNAGRLPLHIALYRALDEDLNTARETYVDLISPLIEVYPLGKDVEDMNMKTGQDLLVSLKQKLKSGIKSESEAMKKHEEEQQEREWKEKLYQEYQYETEEQQSRYNISEDISEEDCKETFSQWTDRMQREYAAKQRSRNSAAPQSHPRKRRWRSDVPHDGLDGKSQTEQEEKLHNARDEMKSRFNPPPCKSIRERLLSRKKIYESKFSRFAAQIPSGKSVKFGNVPWPSIHPEQVVDVLFCDFQDKDSPEYKKYLRVQKVRWHPDKFSQKFGSHIHPDHEGKILARVNAISQTLNAL